MVGILMIVTGLVLHLRSVPSWWFFTGAVLNGRDVSSTPIVSRILLLLLPLFLVGKLAYGWALYRLRWSARSLAVGLLGVQACLLLIRSARMILERREGAPSVPIPWLLLSVACIDLVSILLLYAPGTERAFPAASLQDRKSHQRRMARFAAIRDSWKNLGGFGNTVIVNLALLSWILAPLTYLAAALYYLFAVLPNRPRVAARRVAGRRRKR
jgi:hypothetical protein